MLLHVCIVSDTNSKRMYERQSRDPSDDPENTRACLRSDVRDLAVPHTVLSHASHELLRKLGTSTY